MEKKIKQGVIRSYLVTLTGRTSLLLHHDNIAWSDQMELWKDNPANKGKSKAGDDRTPAFRWIGNIDHQRLVIGQILAHSTRTVDKLTISTVPKSLPRIDPQWFARSDVTEEA